MENGCHRCIPHRSHGIVNFLGGPGFPIHCSGFSRIDHGDSGESREKTVQIQTNPISADSLPDFVIADNSFNQENENSAGDFDLHATATPVFPEMGEFAAESDDDALVIPITINSGATLPASSGNSRAWFGALVFAIACFTLGMLRLMSQTLWVRRRFADCRLITGGPAFEELSGLIKEQRLRCRIRLLSSFDYSEPAAFGLFRWNIVLPQRAEIALTRDELRSLLAHELAHLVRRDTWWLVVGRLLCTAFAYQPLNFLAAQQWQRAAEFICDEWAVRRTGNRLALARCLTTVAEWRIGTVKLGSAMAATGQRSSLSERIECLVTQTAEEKRGSVLRNLALTAAVLAAIIGLITAGPTATFALPTWDAVTESVQADEVNTQDEIAPLDQFVIADAEWEATDDWTALEAELAGLRGELMELEELLSQTRSMPQLKEWTSRLHSRIATLEQKTELLDALRNRLPQTLSLPGSKTVNDTSIQPQ